LPESCANERKPTDLASGSWAKLLVSIFLLLPVGTARCRAAVLPVGSSSQPFSARSGRRSHDRLRLPQPVAILVVIAALQCGGRHRGVVPVQPMLVQLRDLEHGAARVVSGTRMGGKQAVPRQWFCDWTSAAGRPQVPWAKVAGLASAAGGMLIDLLFIVLLGIYLALDPRSTGTAAPCSASSTSCDRCRWGKRRDRPAPLAPGDRTADADRGTTVRTGWPLACRSAAAMGSSGAAEFIRVLQGPSLRRSLASSSRSCKDRPRR
jgi:hypothetical protein